MSTIKWPAIGTSVMLKVQHGKDSEWVDAYVVKREVKEVVVLVVKTFWGTEVTVSDPSLISKGSDIPLTECRLPMRSEKFDFGHDDYELGN